jgi:cell division protein FtsA
MRSKISVGLDIGTNSTKAVVMEHDSKGMFHILGSAQTETSGIRQGYVENIQDVAKSIKKVIDEAERKTGKQINQVTLSLGGISLESVSAEGGAVISRADNEITDLDIEKSINEALERINTANKKVLHEVPIEFHIDGNISYGDPVGMKGVRLDTRTVFVTALERHYDNLLKAVESAGLAVEDVLATPLATSLSVLSERQKNAGCILIDIGQDIVTTAIFEEGHLAAIKTFPVGGGHITNDIALGLQIPLEDAELLKTGHVIGSFPKKKLEEIIEARLTDIFELIQRYLKKIGRHQLLPAGAIIVGAGSLSHSTEDIAKKLLKIPVRVGQAKAILPHKTMRQDPTWFTALGLCIAGRFSENNYNLPGKFGEMIKPVKEFFSRLAKELTP